MKRMEKMEGGKWKGRDNQIVQSTITVSISSKSESDRGNIFQNPYEKLPYFDGLGKS